MEIRLCDITNNKTDIRDYFTVIDDKIFIKGAHFYDVIIDTDKATLHQQMEMFDSKDEMFKKAKAFDEINNIITAGDNVAMNTDSILNEVKKHINDMEDE